MSVNASQLLALSVTLFALHVQGPCFSAPPENIAKPNATASEPVLCVDFAKSTREVHAKAKGSFDGVLPEGCGADFPGWNASVATSRVMAEGSRSFLRITTAKIDASVQFSFPLKDLQLPGSYRLTISSRHPGSDLSLGIRQFPAPYKTLWTGSVPAVDAKWVERRFVIHLDQKLDSPIGLFLFPGLGECDLATITVESLSADEALTLVQRPSTDCRNFFRNSRFPLGLQAGWSVSREFRGGVIDTDPAWTGPSGFPALKLESPHPLTLYSEPFQTSDPAARNFVGLAMRGTGTWTLSVIAPRPSGRSREIARQALAPAPDWKTENLELKLDAEARLSRAFALKLSGTGTLHLDAVQAWAGMPERAYVSQGECEVALGLPPSSLSDTRIQFADEEPVLMFCVTGAVEGSTLKLKIVNLHGEEKPLPDIPLGSSPGQAPVIQRGTFRYDAFGDAMLGQFRVEAKIERNGQRTSPFNEILVTRIRRPVHLTEDAPNSPFGCHFLASPLTIRMMKAAGVNWARFHDAGTDYTGWYHLEPAPGTWTFHDDEIQLYRNNKIKIFGGLQTAPPWASLYLNSGKQGFDTYFDRYFQPSNLAAWSNYVKTVTNRYKGVIDDFFVWNEPWGESFWHTTYDPIAKAYHGGPAAAADYAKLSIAAYRAAKEGNPDCRISGFNTFAGDPGKLWTQGVFDGGAYPFCDMVDYHFYTPKDQGFPGDQAESTFADATGYLRQRVPGFAKPVYMSEGQANSSGSASGSCFGLYHHALPWINEDLPLLNSDKTCRYVVANLAAGAAKVFLYTAHGYEALAIAPSFLTLVGPDGYPQPELAAFANLAWHLEDSQFVRRVPLNHQVWAYFFAQQKGTRTTAVISGLRNGRFDFPVSKNFSVTDLVGNPVPSPARFSGTLLYVSAECDAGKLTQFLRPPGIKTSP